VIAILVRWLIFLHVLAAFTFYMAHGASVVMAFRIRSETDLARIRAMLDLSAASFLWMFISFLIMGLTGLILPFLIHLWGKIYIWLSIVLIVFVAVYMGIFNATHYNQLRRLVGLPYRKGNKEVPGEPPSSLEEATTLLRKTSVTPLIVVGYVIPAIVLWMMMFKPW